MESIIIFPSTYIAFSIFYILYFLSKKCGISDSISKTIPSLSHSIISTLLSLYSIVFYNNSNYYLTCSIMFGYFLSDSIHSIQEIRKPGRKELLAHHLFSMFALVIPPNYWILYAIFLTECSNIPGQITYILIKVNYKKSIIMKSKKYQYWFFLIGRIVLLPFVFNLPRGNLTNIHLNIMYFVFVMIYLMSFFWMVKLHIGYYK